MAQTLSDSGCTTALSMVNCHEPCHVFVLIFCDTPCQLFSNAETSVDLQTSVLQRNLISETPGDSKNTILHWQDVSGPCQWYSVVDPVVSLSVLCYHEPLS